MKKKVLLIVTLAITHFVAAQDIIVTKNSDRIDAKILKVTEEEIEYKQSNNPDGPLFTISVEKISSILYSNGEVQTFDAKIKSKKHTKDDRNYISSFNLGFSMPHDDGGTFYGGYLGYSGKMPINDFISFRSGLWASISGGSNAHMLDLKTPIYIQVGATFEQDMGIYACAGPQLSFGLSFGNELFEYPSSIKRFDVGISLGAGIQFSRNVCFEVFYTFGLINRTDWSGSKINCLNAGFAFYF